MSDLVLSILFAMVLVFGLWRYIRKDNEMEEVIREVAQHLLLGPRGLRDMEGCRKMAREMVKNEDFVKWWKLREAQKAVGVKF